MRKNRGVLSVFLVIIISLSLLILPVNAEDYVSISSKADVLSQLSILKGDGNDYNLEGQLRRCEAAAFIVRILGKEDYVSLNKDQYKTTKFSDVKVTQWYAPYIGYCSEQGIISGYLDGKFKPEDTISEKAFLKLALGVLKYRENMDFVWNNVYQAAYNVGLVSDTAYESKIIDNDKYTRGDVVNVLYNVLKAKKKETNVTVIHSLINEGIINKDIAISAGIISDSIVTAAEKIIALNEDKVSVKFNENIQDNITSSDIKIYETGDFTKKITGDIESLSQKEIIIKTSQQIPDKDYTIEICNVLDAEGNKADTLTGTFKGYRNSEIKSDFFKISKIETVSKNIINLYFTHPININSELPSYYNFLVEENNFVNGSISTLAVKRLNSANNAVTLYLKDTVFAEGVNYTLKVSGDLTSVYGVKLNNGIGESIVFRGKGSENEELKIVGIIPFNSTSVHVEFNKEIDSGFAEKYINYSIKGQNNSTIAVTKAVVGGEGAKKGKAVLLSLISPLDKTQLYELRIEYLLDIFKQTSLEGVTKTFSGSYSEKSDLSINFAMPIDKGTVWVYFNKPLNPNYANMNVNYMITGVTDSNYLAVPVKAYYDEFNGYYVAKLFLPNDKLLGNSKSYKITVFSSMQDTYGNYPMQNIEFKFNGVSTEVIKPTIKEAVIISEDAIRVIFNKEIALETPNILPSNYSLEYKSEGATISKVPVSATYINATMIILKFDNLDYNIQYKIKYDSLKDYSGLNIQTWGDGQNYTNVTVGK